MTKKSPNSKAPAFTTATIPVINVKSTVTGVLNATAWALIYSYPLYIFGNFTGSVLQNVKVNEIFHQTALAEVGKSAVVKPDIDTVYSRVVLDLSKQDVILTTPNICDRYCLYPSHPRNLSSLAPNGSLLGIDTSEKLLNFASKFVLYNQPEMYLERQRVAGILGAAGTYVNITLAAAIANASIAGDFSNTSHIRNQGNSWEVSIVSYQGNYGNNYGGRAYAAIYGYQQLTVIQTLYPGFQSRGGKLPVLGNGFWSLAVYGEDQWLIPNGLDRFEFSERSYNLTYENSNELVYGLSANSSSNGPFKVLLQPADLTPLANWAGN